MGLNFGGSLLQQQGQNLVNYDYYDLANGVGYQIYEGYCSYDNAGVKYNLVDDSSGLFSVSVQSSSGGQETYVAGTVSTGGAAYEKTLDVNFDLTPFKTSKTIQGKIFIRMCYSAGGASGTDSYIRIGINKYIDGVSDTEYATDQTLEMSNYDTEQKISMMIEMPKTQFKKGEQLRLNIKGYSKDAAAGITIGADPANRNVAAASTYHYTITPSAAGITSRLIIHVPFKLDI